MLRLLCRAAREPPHIDHLSEMFMVAQGPSLPRCHAGVVPVSYWPAVT